MGGVLFLGVCDCMLSIFLMLYFSVANNSLTPTPVPGAFIRLWILPRPKKYVAGIFFASPAAMSASSNPSVAKKNTARMGGVLFGGDGGIRTLVGLLPN